MPTAAVTGATKATVPSFLKLVTVESPILFQMEVASIDTSDDAPAPSNIRPFNRAAFLAASVLVPDKELNTAVPPVTLPPSTVVVLVPASACSASPAILTVALLSNAVPLFAVFTPTLPAPLIVRLPLYSTSA